MSAWTPEKTERLKMLVLRHLARGGTVMDACQQFEFETNGEHKAWAAHVRWLLFIRASCGEEYRQARVAGRLGQRGVTPSVPMDEAGDRADTPHGNTEAEQVAPQEDDGQGGLESAMLQSIHLQDELASKLFYSVTEILEDRRQLKELILEYGKRLELAERKIAELQEDNRVAQHKLEKKDQEIEQKERLLLEGQLKYQQLYEDFQQFRGEQAEEYQRLQQQIGELQARYEALNGEYGRFRAHSTREIERLQSQLRESEVRNTQLQAQYDAVRNENANLARRVADFARQISSMLGSDTSLEHLQAAVPIRPMLVKPEEEVGRAKA
ncbi:hypothetical protein [Alicyclobacillus macrosporangiidus]|uniref:hypothetical protein n=1 Tax=Alicyclobacillus macrosporangiidus TaxID=392015 RepID=UPI0004957E62|nr:hypothetical protein [Alicyclobacillus macrosporangiidus]